jgi:hypothetical protein
VKSIFASFLVVLHVDRARREPPLKKQKSKQEDDPDTENQADRTV